MSRKTYDDEQFTELITSCEIKDVKERLAAVSALEEFVSERKIAEEDLGAVVDVLLDMIKENNFKICELALATTRSLIDQQKDTIRVFIPSLLPPVLEKLGDIKGVVRDRAIETVLSISRAQSAKETFLNSATQACFNHKNWRVKEALCQVFTKILSTFGPQSIPFDQVLSHLIKLLADSNSQVREMAIIALEEMYKYSRQSLVSELKKPSYNIRQAQLSEILARFERIQVDSTIYLPIQENTSPKKATTTKKKAVTVNNENSDPQGPTITPMTMSSDKELQEVFQSLLETLQNKQDWASRLEALKSLQSIAVGNASQFPSFVPSMMSIKDALAAQLSDLRSQIVREACNTLSILAKAMGDSFDGLADVFFPALFKLTIVTIQVMSESGNNCLRSIITHCRLTKSMGKIFENCSAKHSLLRSRCAEYVLMLLELSSTSHVEMFVDQFETAIKNQLVDAVPEVRAAARKSFIAFRGHFPERASKVFAALDSNIQKAIKQEESGGMTLKPSIKNDSNTTTKTKPLTGRFASGNSTAQQKVLPDTENAKPRSAQESARPSIRSQIASRKPAPSSKFQVEVIEPKAKAPNSLLEVKLPKKLPQEVLRPITPMTPTPAKEEISAEVIEQKETIVQVKKAPAAKQETKPVVADIQPLDDDDDDEVDSVNVASLDVLDVVNETGSKDWIVRRKSFRRLTKMFFTEKSLEIVSNFKKVIECYISKGLEDPHYKVVIEALTSMIKMIPLHQQNIEPHLERIFPKIFLKLTDSKEGVKTLASQVLESIGENFSGDTLTPILLRVSDNSNSKVKLGCLEYILHLIPNSLSYLNQPNHMRLFTMKILGLASDKKAAVSCKKASTASLMSLYKYVHDQFLEQLVLLPINEQIAAKGMLNSLIPTLDTEIMAASKRKVEVKPPKPKTTVPSQKRNSLSPPTISIDDLPEPMTQKEPEQKRPSSARNSSEHTTFATTRRLSQDAAEIKQALKHSKSQSDLISLPPSRPMSDISYILANIGKFTLQEKREAVMVMRATLRHNKSEEFWMQHFANMLFSTFGLMSDVDEAVREDACMLLTDLLTVQSQAFADFDDITLKRILERVNDPSPSVGALAAKAGEQFTKVISAVRTLEILTPVIMHEDQEVLLASIQLVSKLAQTMVPSVLLAHIPPVLPGLYEAFKHESADIRKAVVYCLVDIYMVLGDSFRPYLDQLNTTQLKLVTIYLAKQSSSKPKQSFLKKN